MAQDNCQKIKLLKLYEMLRQETDEFHPITTNTLCSRLAAMGISCDRRTLAKDISLLNEYNYEILWTWVGKEKGYYIIDRSFSVPELKVLIDAVQASSFITEKKTAELIEKIAQLGGSHRAEILKSNMVCFNTRKHSNENIYFNVEALEEAILQQKKVIFKYFDLNENGERVFRRDGHHYVVEPISLVFNEDNYYLVVYSAKHDSTANYRVDRMKEVDIIDEPICEKALQLRERVSGYTEQSFKMFGGHPRKITIRFDNCLIGAVYDKFGEKIQIVRVDNQHCEATVHIQISPTFWGWLFQFGNLMKITAPDDMIEEYRSRASLFINSGSTQKDT